MDNKNFIKIKLYELLNEDVQLADKIYFNTGKLNKDDKNFIIGLTKRNNWTKLIADFYYNLKMAHLNINELHKKINLLYSEILSYNKNVFPIIGFDAYKTKNVQEIIRGLEIRKDIIEKIKQLPKFAINNLRNDIRLERTTNELSKYYNNLEYFITHYSLLSNRDEKTKEKILKKMFKSGTSLNDLMRFVDDKESFIGGVEFTRDKIMELVQSEDIEIKYDQNNIMILEVYSPDGIKAIGCNSLWCFTYGSGFDSAYRQWNNYSYNGIVYVIVDLRESPDSKDFMHVLIKPLTDENNRLITYTEDNETEIPLFDMVNDNFHDPYTVLKHLFGNGYKSIIKKYLNFNY